MRILIVEDEPGIASFLKEGLEEEDFSVDLAGDGEDGLKMSRSANYDIMLIDWMLPKLSGLDLCKEIRKRDKNVPIIFVTARDTLEDTVAGLKSGANDYIKKPFHFEELLERIRVQLRPIQRTGEAYKHGSLTLDTVKHSVDHDGKPVSLTQKEFALLEYLLKNKNKLCSRKDIIRDVWDIHFEYDTGVIDVYINSLRKKLGLDVSGDFIKTVRGLGYIIED
ncbi:response regulator transcription factor [Fulvivirga sedimenti]|uniref:Response regulator transcription factor n=1 Tax=Fulvivirga sedimenti TaxID=2879465 RepID=A0A9X1HM05_9BACT|nr:response regulator transcription factor [Fulvivirga sedimenti]MCA6074694.1 response regulator transcription factor [Fulvivirga sedimenti]MCA6075871.1 response regulator transcription factor [Fulvivirga sedimenti]MCA6076999.1 response regulator transcription factor [Fulvivirga sedimenti]